MAPGRIASLVATLALCAGAARAEEQTYFQQKVTEKLEELRSVSGGALRGLLLYPKDIRDAILEISMYPPLIVRVYDLGEEPGERLDELMAEYPPETKAAARAEKLGEDALDDWQSRIAGDEEAQKQLQAATEAYQLEVAPNDSAQITTSSGDTINVNVNVDNSAGYQTSSSGSIIIYSVPSYSYSIYVMNHCNLYYMACGHMHYHTAAYAHYYDDYFDDYWDRRDAEREDWQHQLSEGREDRQQAGEKRREDIGDRQQTRRDDLKEAAESGNGGLNQAMKDWKEGNRDALGEGFFKEDGKLNERFQDFGNAQQEFGDGLRSGKLKQSDRGQALRNGMSDAQKSRLSEARGTLGERASTQGGRSQARERAQGARAAGSSRTPTDAARSRTTGSRTTRSQAAGNVQRGQRTRSQSIDRARRSHSGSWGGASRSRHGGGNRGGFGGASRGGGRRR